jgi:energy-coupling factor transporter ATP-binding protein EcfA2
MFPPVTIRYPVRPARRGLAAGQVIDLFGLSATEPPHVVAENLALDIRPGDVVAFSGPSGSGKSSLLRAVGQHLNALDAAALDLPDRPLVDGLAGPLEHRLGLLAACGLGDARLLLRTPGELSDGQRYRFRVALAAATALGPAGSRHEGRGSSRNGFSSILDPHSSILLDEFTSPLDRTLAKVVAFNLRKLSRRTGLGVLAATAHTDVLDDLNPNLLVRCPGDGGAVVAVRRKAVAQPISFAGELRVVPGTPGDWPHFARWHYRSHAVAFVKKVVLLKHGPVPVGVCVFAAPAASLALRSRYFGLADARSRLAMAALNDQLWCLARLVLHPTYRGAGVAADFVREACRQCPVPWIETLTTMGRVNPVFEKAGFRFVGVVRPTGERGRHGAYTIGGSAETVAKSRFAAPGYFVKMNTRSAPRTARRG